MGLVSHLCPAERALDAPLLGPVPRPARGLLSGLPALAPTVPPSPRGSPTPLELQQTVAEASRATLPGSGAGWAAFAEGYLDYDGRPEWLRHFIEDVLPCESSHWGGWYPNGYVSRAQFHVLSWATAVWATNLDRPDDPYAVGANVAWWSNAIEHPGGTGGWATCWWRGVVP